MTVTDVKILGKKILVGLIVAIVPLILIAAGLWLTKSVLTNHSSSQSSTNK
jgi:hypothetical protein